MIVLITNILKIYEIILYLKREKKAAWYHTCKRFCLKYLLKFLIKFLHFLKNLSVACFDFGKILSKQRRALF